MPKSDLSWWVGWIRELVQEVAYDLGHSDSCPMLVVVSLLTSFTAF